MSVFHVWSLFLDHFLLISARTLIPLITLSYYIWHIGEILLTPDSVFHRNKLKYFASVSIKLYGWLEVFFVFLIFYTIQPFF